MSKTKVVRFMAWTGFISLVGGAGPGATLDSATAAGVFPTWEKINGIDTLLAEKHDTPLVTLKITFLAGSYFDPEKKLGLANQMGDLILRGTQSRSREEIENELDFLGASLGVSNGHHTIQLSATVLRKNVDPLVSMIIEILTKPTFPEDELKKLQEELVAHLHVALEDDSHLARRKFLETLFKGHPYSRESIGKLATIRAITRKDIQDFHRNHIHRSGMLMAAAGDLTPKDFKAVVEKVSSRLPDGSFERKVTLFQKKLKGRHVLLVDKPERTQTQFYIGHPGIDANHKDYFPLKVFSTAFGGRMFQAHYMQEIRVKQGWAYGATAALDARRDGGGFYLYTFPAVKDTLPALKLSLELLDKAVFGKGMRDEQLEFAKQYLIRSYPFLYDTPEKQISQVVRNRILGRPADFLQTYADQIRAVTIQSAREAAKRHLNAKNVQIVLLCTAKDFRETIGKELKAASVDIVPFDRL